MSKAPRVILMMIPSSGYDRGILEGIISYARIHGPWVFLLSGDHPELPIPVSDSTSGRYRGQNYLPGPASNSRLPDFRRLNATGMIGRILNLQMLRRLQTAFVPAVGMISGSEEHRARPNPYSNIAELLSDSRTAGRLAAEHFIEQGFWNFAFCGYEDRPWVQLRLDGFAARLLEAGFSPQVYQPQKASDAYSWKRELPVMTAWLKSLPRPVAVMACNDKRGRQVLDACVTCGLRVPEDVAVVGVDNDQLFGNLSNPPLSSVAINLSKMGYQAAELLDSLMHDKVVNPPDIIGEALWVVRRASSNVFATSDPHLASAVRFIREHAREAIGAEDVVSQAGISRRSLELRFKKVMKTSICDEIQHVRLGHAKQLLAETNLSVERISHLSGFCSPSHLGNVLRLETGMTPGQFRQRIGI